jgi:hypothetical protein
MAALASSIQDILQARRSGLPVISLPELSAVGKAYQEVKKKLGEGQASKELTQKEKEHWVTLAKETASNHAWDTLSPQDLKKIGKCLWHNETSPLSSDKELLKDFLSACDNKIRRKICFILIQEYLFHYNKESPAILHLGEWLAKTVPKWAWAWAERQNTFKLFGNSHASSLIADAIFRDARNISETFDTCGIGGNQQSGGMAQSAFGDACVKFGTLTKNPDSRYVLSYLQRLLAWACVDGNSFTYPLLKTSFINSLLLPWQNATPDPDIKGQIQGFLVDRFGDPRLGGASWNGVEENAMRVIRGWLVERALAQFLDVVDELALDHQWKYRRAFWMAYYERNTISDAWVAFAERGAREARQIAKRSNDSSWLRFGRLYGSNDENHAVLILRIGDLTIADYSHNGKCRLWKRGNKEAPQFYKDEYYHRDNFVNSDADSEDVHHNSPGYLWQGRVAAKISDITGIRINQKDYTPR